MTITFIIIVNVFQAKKPNFLPLILRSWNFLPKCLRSLEPYDRVMSRVLFCKKFQKNGKTAPLNSNFNNSSSNSVLGKPVVITSF